MCVCRGNNITLYRCDVKSQRISSCRKRKEAFAVKAKKKRRWNIFAKREQRERT